jgi:hypothetical protein
LKACERGKKRKDTYGLGGVVFREKKKQKEKGE